MKIKKLEINGFKSFPDKTVLEFKPGVSAIVGPNGCGKSNIFEAIRWVMGEQRVRTLRSKKMEDVIFNGSDSRKPVGMAEVRMVLSDTGGAVPPSMADYDEIMITRRLFRDGDSQYEINNVPCRLADVTDFFLDTGVGRNSYAIIEQGRVDMVVASKPEDRRVLIEEAAGINRYKARREAAIKKLEQTQQNLLRISDVISEVKRQSASLKRQAARAQRYQMLSDRLKALDLQSHASRCSLLQSQLDRFSEELEKNRSLLLEKQTSFASAHAGLEKERLKALDTERRFKELLESRHKTDLELTSLRGRIEKDRTAIAQLQEFGRRSQDDKKSLEQRIEEARLRSLSLDKERRSAQEGLEHNRLELEKALAEMHAAEQTLNHQKLLKDRLKEDIFRTLQQTAQERNRRESLNRRKTEISGELNKIEQESLLLAQAIESDRAGIEEFIQKAREIASLREEVAKKKDQLINDRKEVIQQITSLRERVGHVEKELAAKEARRESIREMQESYSVYEEGVRFLMQDPETRGKNSLLGPLAEMIEVPPEFQKALAAALGERLGHVVVSSPREGIEAAGRLEEAGAGRTTFIPLYPRFGPDKHPKEVPTDLKSLSEIVRFRAGMEGLADFLLSRCFVVDDIGEAIEIWEKNGIQVDLVTRKGEVLNRHGEITGGSQEKLRDEVFERKREIAELSEQIALLETEAASLRSSLANAEEQLEKLSTEIDLADRRINEYNVAAAQISKDHERVEAQVQSSKRRLEVLSLETERFSKELDGITGMIEQTLQSITLLEAKLKEMERENDEAALKVEELTASIQQKSGQTGEIRVRLAQLEERDLSLERECRSAREAVAQMEGQISVLVKEIEQKAAEKRRLATEIEDAQARERDLMMKHETQAAHIEGLKHDSEAAAEALNTLEEQAASAENSIRVLTETVHGLEMEMVRVRQTLDGLVEKILERYQVDPRTIPAPDSPPDEAEIADVKAKLESIGEVNQAAIAESRYIEERLAFLTDQEDDLKKAVDSLYATIDKINATTRERFREAFDSINVKFQEIFPFLFRGGEARLELTDDDILETGVDIMARPPGKRIRNMDLLSGGEKALTAVALIFSIFLTRPSPFCLLDEVDAPLDDSNIDRFNEMLKKLSADTQFFIVTHNKRSMEAADTLYGVTMEEPGVSAVVSVEFIN